MASASSAPSASASSALAPYMLCNRVKCDRKTCTFGHSVEELQPKDCTYGKECRFYDSGSCKNIHPDESRESFNNRVTLLCDTEKKEREQNKSDKKTSKKPKEEWQVKTSKKFVPKKKTFGPKTNGKIQLTDLTIENLTPQQAYDIRLYLKNAQIRWTESVRFVDEEDDSAAEFRQLKRS